MLYDVLLALPNVDPPPKHLFPLDRLAQLHPCRGCNTLRFEVMGVDIPLVRSGYNTHDDSPMQSVPLILPSPKPNRDRRHDLPCKD